jgi:ERCC4-type nuclease
MILVDSRIGSKELFPLFPKGSAQLATLQFGDFSFIGNGPGGMPYNIGIERKLIREIAGDISIGRLVGHQIPGMIQEYQVSYLIVEGKWRGDPKTGILQSKKHGKWEDIRNGETRYTANSIRKFLFTQEIKWGIRLHPTANKMGTVQEVVALYEWWTEKEWEEHRSHIVAPYPLVENVRFRKPSAMEYFAACVLSQGSRPIVGKRSRAAEEHFDSLLSMVLADKREWMKVEGVGEKIAQKVVDVLQGRKGNG